MRRIVSQAAALLVAATVGGAAQAADLPGPQPSPAPLPVPASWSPLMIRLRALVVQPDEDARLRAGGATIANGKVDISTAVVPEIDITYFFTPNIAAELIAGVTRHDVKGAGALAGTKIGRTWLLPPTLTVQYHFTDLGPFKPYLGVGVNYTTYFDEKPAFPFNRFKLGDSWGAVLQAGADIMIDDHWGWNVDVKKVFMEPTVSINRRAITGRVTIDPWLVGTGLVYRF